MKVLIACIPTPSNRYLVDLKKGLDEFAEVVWDEHEFWEMKNEYDIIHIHWPEYLSFEIERYLRNSECFPQKLWDNLKKCLNYWKQNAQIIHTRHNTLPHARQDQDFQQLYKLIGAFSSTVVHFANFSIQQFKEFYPDLNHVKHVVIPHHNYASLPNLSTKSEARKKLAISKDAHVMLVFGSIKENEKSLINKAFGAIPHKNKVLLAPGWKIVRRKIGYIRLREWVWKLEKWILKLNKKRRIDIGFIKEEDAHYYLNAADFLFIPRTNELNSGNITLGCTFGLVVVGKEDADIGEILKETGNLTFKVGNDQSVSNAIQKALHLKETNHGESNKSLALSEWSVEKIAKDYIEIMRKLILKA